jgi:Rab proteins geranylgeranyltransferase component A
LTLQDAEEWVASHSAAEHSDFLNARLTIPLDGGQQLRGCSLALAPQLVHTRSDLLSQLVSSRAYRQVEFLAVGAFFVLKRGEDASHPTLTRIPSTREDVFSTTAIPARAKRQLMKFLKFVLDYEAEQNVEIWHAKSDDFLVDFLRAHFGLEEELRMYILALTLTLDNKVTVKDGLAIIHRHLTSMGVFGPGFAAVYPKWGGLGEVAQVACRAGAVGGAVYMLGTGVDGVVRASGQDDKMQIRLSNEMTVKAKMLVRSVDGPSTPGPRLARLVAVMASSSPALFVTTMEGAPTPAVAVVAISADYFTSQFGQQAAYPVYAMAHSSETGECAKGQSKYFL